jgi:general secretion pathway protein A
MYTAYFGLTEPPFAITPDPRYLFLSRRHREALAHLLYGAREGGGFVQLTGEVGTGKTTVCRCFLDQIPGTVNVAFILNPRLTDVEMLATVCDELRVPYPPGTTSLKVLVDALHGSLLEAHAQGRRTVLVIDEAQNLAPEVLEQVRLLTNLETPRQKLLHIILIGQPELAQLLDRPQLRQLAQRITARYHLTPFSSEETPLYVRHRLAVAGQRDRLFTDRALRQVHALSRGVPRLINIVCDRALLGAYAHDRRRVDAAMVRRAAREVLGAAGRPRLTRPAFWFPVAAMAAILTGAWMLLPPEQRGHLAGGMRLLGASLAPPVSTAKSAGQGATGGGSAAPTVPAPAGRSPGSPVVANGGATLQQVLADPGIARDRSTAFARLFARWGVEYDPDRGGPACEHGRSAGLQCLFRSGTWTRLRRFNLPAVIDLVTPGGQQHHATVVALGDRTATLDLGGREHTFPLGEIDRFWDGSFVLLWRPPPLSGTVLAPGARGRDVIWLRERLSEFDGGPAGSKARDAYDDEVRDRVAAFQRSRSLVPDGIVGEETLTHLVTSPRDPAPTLLSTTRR